LDQPTNVHEYWSRIQYNVLNKETRRLELASEWVRVFELRLDYLELALLEVQTQFFALKKRQAIKNLVTPGCSLFNWI
jgi:hypothetical protein